MANSNIMDKDVIKVLWVENDPAVLNAYPLEAEMYGIDLDPYECWDDARAALLANYDSYDAIILDAKCKHHKNSVDNATRFLTEVFADLSGIFIDKGRHLNWYVLSGEIGEDDETPIPERRKQWDGDWPKDHYSKTQDREILYKRIRAHVIYRSNAIQIMTSFYPDVFRAIDTCNMDESAKEEMISLLEPMHFSGTANEDYNNRLVSTRRVLEYLFRSMITKGILPPSFRSEDNSKDTVNLTWCSLFLAGKPDSRSLVECKSPVFPRVIAENVKNIIYAAGSSVHTVGSQNNISMREYLQSVGNTTNLIKSFALQLCDVILWYESFLREHPDPEENMQNWKMIK